MLTLREAIKSGRLSDFIKQEENRGIGPADKAAFDHLAERVIKTPLPEDQTSRSPSLDGSSEK